MEPDRDCSFDKSTNFAGLIYFYTYLFICVHGSVGWSNQTNFGKRKRRRRRRSNHLKPYQPIKKNHIMFVFSFCNCITSFCLSLGFLSKTLLVGQVRVRRVIHVFQLKYSKYIYDSVLVYNFWLSFGLVIWFTLFAFYIQLILYTCPE